MQNGQQGAAVGSGARLYACSFLDGGGHVEIVDELIARLVPRYARPLDHQRHPDRRLVDRVLTEQAVIAIHLSIV
jgi:hypothetical protein